MESFTPVNFTQVVFAKHISFLENIFIMELRRKLTKNRSMEPRGLGNLAQETCSHCPYQLVTVGSYYDTIKLYLTGKY